MRSGFVIHHNGPDVDIDADADHDRCVTYWNGVRRYHMETKGWSDIAYSFGICAHGERFVGRGWDRAQFANGADVVGVDDGSDAHWYTVLVFLGWNADPVNPVDEEPSPAMVAGVRQLVAEGRSSGRCADRVLPHNAFKPKRCPGATFTRLAAEWDEAPLTSGDDDLMAAADDILEAIAVVKTKIERTYNQVNLRTGALANAIAALGAEVGDVDEAALAAQLAGLLEPSMPSLSDDDLARIAKACADESARRQVA